MKFSSFRLRKRSSDETEDPSEKFILYFQDVLYGHKLTIEVEREEFEEWIPGRHIDWQEVIRQGQLVVKDDGKMSVT